MKALTAAQQTQHNDLAATLDAARDALETALRRFDERARELWAEDVDPYLTALNAALEAAETFRDGVAAEMDDYSAERSDRWLEGAAGEAFQEWRTAWEVSLDSVELDVDDALEETSVDFDAVETFLALPLDRDDA